MSKLNPQKASAYVGPGVLRKGGKITPVPNGPLIKKKGPYAGSTLKAGGKVKKAFLGSSMFKDNPIYKKTTAMRGMIGNAMGIPGKPIVKNGGPVKKAQNGTSQYSDPKPLFDKIKKTKDSINDATIKLNERKKISDALKKISDDHLKKQLEKRKLKLHENKPKSSFKAGGMIKRADGSYSKRGLWDNIRANKGSGKKPTAEMLKQERKIKAKK
jgi:hypothetical protein